MFRAGRHEGCTPPYHFVPWEGAPDTNFFSQHDAAQCAKKKDWAWSVIVDEYYPDNRTSKGWVLKDVWKPDFDKAKASSASGGKVGINWEGTGIWRSTVHRCRNNDPEPPVCSLVVFDKGFESACGCIRTFAKDDAPQGTIYKIRIEGPGGEKIKYVTY